MAINSMRETGLSDSYGGVTGVLEGTGNPKTPAITDVTAESSKRFLSTLSGEFDKNVVDLKKNLDSAFAEIKANASDPTALAKYQAALAEYTLYRNAQSNAVKAYKDIDMAIVRNFN